MHQDLCYLLQICDGSQIELLKVGFPPCMHLVYALLVLEVFERLMIRKQHEVTSYKIALP